MLNLARNPTIHVPIDAALYDGLDPMLGESSNLSCTLFCLDNGLRLDSDGTFKAAPTSPCFPMQEYAAFANTYHANFVPVGWPRGHYRGLVSHTSGRQFAYDFTIGLYVNRRLGFSVVYNGSAIKLSLWVEENGDLQTDYTTLTDLKITDLSGNVIGTLPDNVSPSEGIFGFDVAVPLSANTHYLLKCKANAPGPAGFPTYTFPLMLGIARP